MRDVLTNRAGTEPDWGDLSFALFLYTPNGRARDEVRRWLRTPGFSNITGPFCYIPLSFDPDSTLIAEK